MCDSDASSHPKAGVKVPRDPGGLVPGKFSQRPKRMRLMQ